MKKLFLKISLLSLLCVLPLSKAEAVQTPPLVFAVGDETVPVTNEQLLSWQGVNIVSVPNMLAQNTQTVKSSIQTFVGQTPKKSKNGKLYNFQVAPVYEFAASLAKKFNTEKIEPSLQIKNNQFADFVAPQNGRVIDIYKTTMDALQALQIGNSTVSATSYDTFPQKHLSDTNNLGINELVAQGVSNFKGSPKNRRFNIAAGVEKFKGLIIPKGAEFSFDDNLGPVDGEHGFLPELVIKAEGTIPEFGGGLCQVSSTAFRAAMAAGLPITARRNHAYAVQYYAPQGTDATIYPGSADLKFINDTPGAILVWPYQKDKDTLIFDFYGTKDSRQVTLEKPIQYDRKPDGSLKASWTREVVSPAGEKRTDVFKSTYQSPALFHKTETLVTTPIIPTIAPPA